MICKFCAKKSIFTNKVNKCSHCAGFVDSFGGCLPRPCEMQHDAHVTFFNCCCSETQRRKTQRKRNAMQLFNLWRLFCPEMQSCMERNCLCAVIPIIFFAIETEGAGIQRDTQGYIGIHVYPSVSRCIPSPGYVSRCIPVYPRVSP